MDANSNITWKHLLETDWFLAQVVPYLSFGDLRCLSATDEEYRGSVLALMETWPDDVKGLFRSWNKDPPSPSRLLVFGIHGVAKDHYLYRNPSLILQFTFDRLAFHAQKDQLKGNPWSIFPTANAPPLSLGRIGAMVCPVDDSGSRVFYCGGRVSVPTHEERWMEVRSMDKNPSTVTAVLDVATATWRELPPMPTEGRCRSGICRIGATIYILGGELANSWDGSMSFTRSILCFDLIGEHWFRPGFDDYPGEAHTNFAVVAKDDSTIVVAGGEGMTEWHPQYGPLAGLFNEVFSLNTNTGAWTRLSPLPEDLLQGNRCFGYTARNEGEPTIVVFGRKKWARLNSEGRWLVEPNLCNHGLKSIRFDTAHRKIFTGISWRELPPQSSAGLALEDPSNDEAVTFYVDFNSTVIEIV